MKRKCICLLFWVLLIALSYGGGYLCMAWPITELKLSESPVVLPVTAGKENFVLPETRLVMETVNLKTGEESREETAMPAVYLGLDREDILLELNAYMADLSIKEREEGLVAFELESYSTQEMVLRKLYYPDENFNKYYMIYKQGRMVVYYSDQKTVYDYPDIKLYELPLDLQCQVISGMKLKDEVELYNFLQNYSS